MFPRFCFVVLIIQKPTKSLTFLIQNLYILDKKYQTFCRGHYFKYSKLQTENPKLCKQSYKVNKSIKIQSSWKSIFLPKFVFACVFQMIIFVCYLRKRENWYNKKEKRNISNVLDIWHQSISPEKYHNRRCFETM